MEAKGSRSADLLLDQKWDAAIDLTLRRVVYSSAGGAAAALTLFRSPTTRWSAIAFGAGIGSRGFDVGVVGFCLMGMVAAFSGSSVGGWGGEKGWSCGALRIEEK
ncbi:hypothetical protein AXG93_2675s1030 [Marchantia polymorpha subsp. ruderalis]|uniref:Uncharacterized protein n=1 Tax=Marchantia polymorpha subsp. ruderalis TaxID=1480154 RepID=A0A176VP28_MARPO|nr:hypothetical protein AXG93_2675s1030 [Marchantia polymorpha subsp. ruderalis]